VNARRLLLVGSSLVAGSLTACGTSSTTSLPVHMAMPDMCETWGLPLAEQTIDCPGQFRIILRDDEGTLIQERCPRVDPGLLRPTFAQVPELLATLDPQFDPIPDGARIRFDLDYYDLGLFCSETDEPSTPGGQADNLEPLLQGRSDVITVGEVDTIEIPMGCGLLPPFCPDEPATPVQTVTATVQNLESLTLLQQAFADSGAIVSPGYPLPQMDFLSFQFVANGFLQYAGAGVWSSKAPDDILFPFDCVGSIVSVGDGTPIATCDGAPDQLDNLKYNVSAYYLEEARMRDLAAAAGVTTFGEGLILGRIVDGARRPVAGATVQTGDGSLLQVKYLDDAATGLASTAETSTSGWFVIDSTSFGPGQPRCCTSLQAELAAQTSLRSSLVGLFEGTVLATVIELP